MNFLNNIFLTKGAAHQIDQDDNYRNTNRDIEVQKIANLRAAISLIEQIQEKVDRGNGSTEISAPLSKLKNQVLEELRIKEESFSCQEARPTGIFRLIFGWKRASRKEQKLALRVEKATSETLKNLKQIQLVEFYRVKSTLGYTKETSLKSIIKKELRILKQKERAQLHRGKKELRSEFNLAEEHNNGSAVQVVDFAKRMNTVRILEKQTQMQLSETEKVIEKEQKQIAADFDTLFEQDVVNAIFKTIPIEFLIYAHSSDKIPAEHLEAVERSVYARIGLDMMQSPQTGVNIRETIEAILEELIDSEPNKLSELRDLTYDKEQLKIQLLLYREQNQNDEWRTSTIAQSEHQSVLTNQHKSSMTVNPWIETVTMNGEELMKVGRTGAYSDFSYVASNIDRMSRIGTEAPHLLKERKKTIMDQAVAAFVEHGVELANQLNNALLSEDANYLLDIGTIPYSQFSLLNPKGKELNMLKDMAWAIGQLHNKKVIFDGQCGMDCEGVIHIPVKVLKEGKPITLEAKTNVYNFYVQGSAGKAGKEFQQTLNDKAWKTTETRYWNYSSWLGENGQTEKREELQTLWSRVVEIRKNNPSNYEIAALLARLEYLMSSSVGINCKSGKDRTSYLIKTMISQTVLERTPNMTKRGKQQMNNQIMRKGVGHFITGLNTGVKALKVQRSKVLGLGLGERIRMLMLAAFVGT